MLYQTISVSGRFVSHIRSSKELSLVTPPSFAISVFHMTGPSDSEGAPTKRNQLTQALYRKLEERRDIKLTKTVLNDIFCIRFAVGSARTEGRHVDAAYEIILNEARAVIAEDLQVE